MSSFKKIVCWQDNYYLDHGSKYFQDDIFIDSNFLWNNKSIADPSFNLAILTFFTKLSLTGIDFKHVHRMDRIPDEGLQAWEKTTVGHACIKANINERKLVFIANYQQYNAWFLRCCNNGLNRSKSWVDASPPRVVKSELGESKLRFNWTWSTFFELGEAYNEFGHHIWAQSAQQFCLQIYGNSSINHRSVNALESIKYEKYIELLQLCQHKHQYSLFNNISNEQGVQKYSTDLSLPTTVHMITR